MFTVMNLYQIGHIYWERRPVVLSPEEQKLYDMGFHDLTPREFVSLLMLGQWHDAASGDRILVTGAPTDTISIAVSGTIRISRHERDVGKVEPGQVIGTAFSILGEPSTVDATFAQAGRYIVWPLSQIRAYMEKKPELRATLQRMANRELAKKVAAAVSV